MMGEGRTPLSSDAIEHLEDDDHGALSDTPQADMEEPPGVMERLRRGVSGMLKRGVTVFMSEETEKQFSEVLALADSFFADVEHGSLRSMVGMRVLAGMNINLPQRTELRCLDESLLAQGFYWFQHAEATFGWSLLHVQKGRENGFSMESNEIIAMKYLKLQKGDIVRSFFGAALHTPGHILCVDHRRKSVVIAVRGTFSMMDIMADLTAKQAPFLGGFAHEGMVKCCENLFMTLMPTVVELLEEHEGYSLVTTGHSLGASVAVMLALRVREAMPELNVRCWAYGCPPCVSWDLANLTTEFCVSFSCGIDIVPRLSLQHMTDLKKRLKVILAKQSTGFWSVVKQGAVVSSEVEQQLVREGLILASDGMLEWCPDLRTEVKSQLWGPPRIIDMYKDEHGVMRADDSSLSQFGHVVVGPNMFKDHMPQSYDRALRRLLTDMRAEEDAPEVEMKEIRPSV